MPFAKCNEINPFDGCRQLLETWIAKHENKRPEYWADQVGFLATCPLMPDQDLVAGIKFEVKQGVIHWRGVYGDPKVPPLPWMMGDDKEFFQRLLWDADYWRKYYKGKIPEPKKPKKTFTCPACGAPISEKGRMCRSCANTKSAARRYGHEAFEGCQYCGRPTNGTRFCREPARCVVNWHSREYSRTHATELAKKQKARRALKNARKTGV